METDAHLQWKYLKLSIRFLKRKKKQHGRIPIHFALLDTTFVLDTNRSTQ